MPNGILGGWDDEMRDEPPCSFVRAPWLTSVGCDEHDECRQGPCQMKPSASEPCFVCGQRKWQHDMVTR